MSCLKIQNKIEEVILPVELQFFAQAIAATKPGFPISRFILLMNPGVGGARGVEEQIWSLLLPTVQLPVGKGSWSIVQWSVVSGLTSLLCIS
jgi:hypothetical protein